MDDRGDPFPANVTVTKQAESLPGGQWHEKSLYFRIQRIGTLMRRDVRLMLAERFGIKEYEWRVLVVLANHGPISARDFSEYTLIQRSHISQALKSLEKDGYAISSRDGRDRRVQLFALTERGVARYDEIRPSLEEKNAALIAYLAPRQVEQVYGLLDSIESYLDCARAPGNRGEKSGAGE
jgi:DNA-binding MarR family transcriptional regulator